MVEVFKTDVPNHDHASMILELIHKNFGEYQANFDLDDCDKILRIKCTTKTVQASYIIDLLKDVGFLAEVLPDESPLAKPVTLPWPCCFWHKAS